MSQKGPELEIWVHPDGRTFLEIESLVQWFEWMAADPEGSVECKLIGKGAAYTIRMMEKRGFQKPTSVRVE